MDDEIHGDSTVVGPSVAPKLQIVAGEQEGKVFTLKFKTRAGREGDNDVVITDPKISRYHFQISFEDGKWTLSDYGSVNGTYINGMRVNVPQALSHLDQIALGETILIFIDPLVAKGDAPIDPASISLIRPQAASSGAASPAPLDNRKRLAWIAGGLLLILILALIGLSWLSRNNDNQPDDVVNAATETPTTEIIRSTPDPEANLELKFEDDFSDSFGGWDDAFGNNFTKQYGNNRYHIEITTNDLVVWGLANRITGDFEVEVEAVQENLGPENTYGMIFRYNDPDNYYRFDISGDGFYLLSKFHDGVWSTLADWQNSDTINQGNSAINVLKVSAFGPDIAVSVNGEELTRIEDDTFDKGNFGFFASTFDSPNAWVSFDNLRLWGPPDQDLVQIFTTSSSDRLADTPASSLDATPTTASVAQADPLPTDTPTVAAAAAEPAPASEAESEVESTEPAEPTAAEAEPTPTGTPATESTPTPEPLPEFVSRDQPLARGEQSFSGKIYFPLYDPDRGTYDLYRADATGTNRELIQEDASQPALNSTGDTIAYRSWKPDERGLIARPLEDGDKWIFVNFFEAASPVFSPDDQFFVFHSRQGGRTPGVYRTFGNDHEIIRRDGIPVQGEMIAIADDNRITYRGCTVNTCGIVISNLDGSFPHQLTSVADDTAPAISPDGSTIAFMSNRDGNWEIYTIGVDGQNLQQLTTDSGNDGLPTWSPDGNRIAFVTNRDGEWSIWSMTATGEQQRQLFLLDGSIDGIAQVDTAHAFGWLEERIVWTE